MFPEDLDLVLLATGIPMLHNQCMLSRRDMKLLFLLPNPGSQDPILDLKNLSIEFISKVFLVTLSLPQG